MKIRADNVAHAAVRQPEGIPGLPGPDAGSWNGIAGTLLLIHAALALLAVLLQRAWPLFRQLVSSESLSSYVTGSLIMQGGLIFLPTVLVIVTGRLPASSLLGGKARSGSLILAFTAGIPAAVVFQGMNNLLIYALAKSGVQLPVSVPVYDATGGDLFGRPLPVILVVVLISAIIPGLVEELMFRGVILASLSSAGAAASAVIWQAAAFALFHGDPLFILPPLFAGLLLAHIRRCSDSLLPAMLAHISLNFSLMALAPLLPQLTAEYLTGSSSEASSLLYASLIAAFVSAVALVPLIVLIGHLQGRRPEHGRLHFWPGDWKFVLAFAVLIVTMIIEFN